MNVPTLDPSHDILRQSERHPLDPLFSPRSVAVIGATEAPGSVGRTLLKNLISNPFGGTVYPVNPKRPSVLGIKSSKSVLDIADDVDLAVIATPAASVPAVIDECVKKRIPGAVILSAGFREMGEAGAALEAQVLQRARAGGLRFIGPNCLGLMNPRSGLNATFAKGMARPGNIAFLSQSGALCTAVLDWSLREWVGFSAFISTGSMADVSWGDLIDYLGNDPQTQSILIYMESVGDARAFLSAAREVALTKPIIVIKPGRTAAAAQAAASHTGSLTGSDEVLDAAFKRSGVLRVQDISDLFDVAEVLAKQPRPRGRKLGIVTNAGGPGVLATDALIGGGGELSQLSQETIASLNKFLPSAWSRSNPIDVLGDAGPERYAQALQVAAADPASDGLLVILTPQDMTDPTRTADELRPYARLAEGTKPLLASWMGGPDVAAGQEILRSAGIPTFSFPDAAVRAFNFMWRSSENLRQLYETPVVSELASVSAQGEALQKRGRELLERVRASGRTILTEFESKELLALYGIPIVETAMATTEDEAATLAEKMGFPVVLKLLSETITHKSDVGGVKLNLNDRAAVMEAFRAIRQAVTSRAGAEHFLGVTVQAMISTSEAYEVIFGSSLDPQFGPVLLFGSGGQLVEVYRDRALGLPPLNPTLALRMMEQTKIFRALQGVRGRKPVDLNRLAALLARFSELVVEQPLIREIDINPLLASARGFIALDARVVVHPPGVDEAQLPRSAIRPYPAQYVKAITLRDGSSATLRPIRPEDEGLMVDFHGRLSARSVEMRYRQAFEFDKRVAHDRMVRVCFADYDREMPLIAVKDSRILGIARLSKDRARRSGRFTMIIADDSQRQGLGSILLTQLLQVAQDEGLLRLTASVRKDNAGMLRLCEEQGFTRAEGSPGEWVVEKALSKT